MKQHSQPDRSNRQGLSHILVNNLRMYIKIARMTPAYFILTVLKGLFYGASSSATAIFTVRLFDAIDAEADFPTVAVIIGYMALFQVIFYLFNAIHRQFFNQLYREKLKFKLHNELFQKARSLDLACYDDPEYYNDFVWAMEESDRCAVDMMNDLAMMIEHLVAGTTLFSLLFSIDIGIAILLLSASILSIVINQIANKESFAQEKEMKPLGRVRSYLNRVFYLQEYAKEIRMSHVTDLLMQRMDENTEQTVRISRKYGKIFFILYGICDTLLSNAVYFAILFFMFFKLADGSILVGGFAATMGMIWNVRWQLRSLVLKLAKFPKNSLFLEKYYDFLASESKTVSGEQKVPPFESLELRDVTFRYDFSAHTKDLRKEKCTPSENKPVLQNISLKLHRGEKIAIVGYNGAGKTTLIKLLMHLYDTTDGQILWNGKDIRSYNLEQYRSRIGVVFQDFKIFAATVAENVMNGTYCETTDKDTVLHALNAAGFSEKLKDLSNGVNTMLTREFDNNGTNLSGGESQKLAIARVFAKPYELIIMDEPSSALDPMSEYALNQAILEYAADKTVIFISHRLSTTRMADRIYLFDSGTLKEVGSHDELMMRNEKYAQMFRLQAEKYKQQS